ncbi:MAG: hypothetical protein JSV05_03340 [Candidatus Bathyarchaeota archaeon]|nr:MAG: hypothetical protein JSV05_03340 [Candidatus Bathyarchaeota archaeon]
MKVTVQRLLCCICILSIVFSISALVSLSFQEATAAVLRISPSSITEEAGQSFIVNITISNVSDLYGWEFRLAWNSSLLEATSVFEGAFLKAGGETFFPSPIVNNTAGHMLVDCTLIGSIPGVSGSGVLAIITFFVENSGECLLDLHGTILINSSEYSIAHIAVDGYFSTGSSTLIWDVTGDGYVGVDDIVAVAEHFGTQVGDPDWDPIFDVNRDSYVGIDDIVEVAEHFGESS